jgi:hypothetical protein
MLARKEMSVSLSNVIQACVIREKVAAPAWKMKDCFAADEAEKSQTYIVSLDWTKICGPNWQFFYSTAEKQQKMCCPSFTRTAKIGPIFAVRPILPGRPSDFCKH